MTYKKTRLTKTVSSAGWASKLDPGDLQTVLSQVKPVVDENLLVGRETNDDAGVYRINEELAIINTTDYFTPIVDDPYSFGAIAAANALDTSRLATTRYSNYICFEN